MSQDERPRGPTACDVAKHEPIGAKPCSGCAVGSVDDCLEPGLPSRLSGPEGTHDPTVFTYSRLTSGDCAC